jgi:serine/threonine-protein kinase
MAEVYKASDEVLGRTVAVKVMLPHYAADPTFATRFKQEAQAAANLQSPYIVNIYDWGHDQVDDTYYIVMEYVRGTDLKTAIEQRGAIGMRKVAEIGSQVCSALNVAHGYDIIHRDIKPHNIMVQPDGNSKVMDFGIARANNANLTQTGSVLGTAYYVSPEQAQGKPLSTATDIYSLGVVLYEAATGQVPFEGPDPVSIAVKQVNDEPVPPSELNADIDPMLESIIMSAMQKDPAQRFSTAEQMRVALNDYLAGRETSVAVDPSARTQVLNGQGRPVRGPGGSAGGNGALGGARVPYGERDEGPRVIPEHVTAVLPPVGATRPVAASGRAGRPGRPGNAGRDKDIGKRAALIVAAIAVVVLVVVGGLIVFNVLGVGGNATIAVPRVTGMSETEAASALRESGFEVGQVTREPSESIEAGRVIRQNPSATAKAPKGAKVALVVSSGSDKVAVPDLRGKTPDEAKDLLKGLGLEYGTGQNKPDPAVESGRIASQSPAKDTMVSPGTKIVCDLSSGPENRTVPNVYGLSLTEAREALERDGFVVAVGDEVYSSVVEAGCVTRQDKTGSVRIGDTVTLTLSKGPEPVQPPKVDVPPVVGMGLSAANAALTNVGLVLDYESEPGPGMVVKTQLPVAGTSVEKGSRVKVVFGPSTPELPDDPSGGGVTP